MNPREESVHLILQQAPGSQTIAFASGEFVTVLLVHRGGSGEGGLRNCQKQRKMERMAILSPSSVAVIGASASPQKVGHLIFRNLVTQGYQGTVYAINPKGGEILGEKVYATLAEVPGVVEMAVVVTPATTVAAVAEECGSKQVKMLVVVTAGFSEIHTDEGRRMEDELVAICKKHGMQLIGPNCLGVLAPSIGMNASFAKDLPAPGPITLISQSGALAVALIDQSIHLGVGYASIVSIGNKAMLDECDFLEFYEKDAETKVIGLYLENIRRGTRFIEIAARVGKTKPIVLLKSGVSVQGRRAAASHTGALAGSSAAIDAACVQAGIHRAQDSAGFLMLLQTLSTQPTLASNRIAVITNAGGPGILATDRAELAGLSLPALDLAVGEKLKSKLPASASIGNPIDVIGDAMTDRYGVALDAAGNDPGIDGVVALLTPQVMTPVAEIAEAIVDMHLRFPLMPITTCFMGGPSVEEGLAILRVHGIPSFTTPEGAIDAMATLLPSRGAEKHHRRSHAGRASQAEHILAKTGGLLDEMATAKLLALYGLPQPAGEVAQTQDAAAAIAERIGYPVIAKISSPDILHKTDIGGVVGNLQDVEEVRAAFSAIMANVSAHGRDATIRGVLIQKHLPAGNEFIIGGVRDPSFGHLVMVGIGGIYTELFRDTAFRIAPIAEQEAYRMLTELKSWKLLLGMRGKSQSDIVALASAIVQISLLLVECPQIKELDCNPVLVTPEAVSIVDAKVVVAP